MASTTKSVPYSAMDEQPRLFSLHCCIRVMNGRLLSRANVGTVDQCGDSVGGSALRIAEDTLAPLS